MLIYRYLPFVLCTILGCQKKKAFILNVHGVKPNNNSFSQLLHERVVRGLHFARHITVRQKQQVILEASLFRQSTALKLETKLDRNKPAGGKTCKMNKAPKTKLYLNQQQKNTRETLHKTHEKCKVLMQPEDWRQITCYLIFTRQSVHLDKLVMIVQYKLNACEQVMSHWLFIFQAIALPMLLPDAFQCLQQ